MTISASLVIRCAVLSVFFVASTQSQELWAQGGGHQDPFIGNSQTEQQSAKSLSGRFGLGLAHLGPGQKPAVSLDWQVSQASSLQFNLALQHQSQNNQFQADALYSRNLFIEEHMHYFLYFGGGLLTQSENAASKSGFLVEGGAGGRFFLQGLPHLGLSFRGGLSLNKIDGSNRFGTVAHMGAHYYF